MASPHVYDLTTITPREFVPPFPERDPHKRYLSHSAYDTLIVGLRQSLGISIHHLGQLLQVPNDSMMYHWLSFRHRPGHVYMGRMMMLALMKMSGVPLVRAEAIDWEAGEIIWSKGHEPRTIATEAK